MDNMLISKEFLIKLDDALGLNEEAEVKGKKEEVGKGAHNPNKPTMHVSIKPETQEFTTQHERIEKKGGTNRNTNLIPKELKKKTDKPCI